IQQRTKSMNIAYWCVLIAGLLPYLAIGVAKWNRSYLRHNGDPRAWEAKLTGTPARAHAAHLNSFEAFPLFAAGVIVAGIARAPSATVDVIAMIFIAARIAYLVAYLADADKLRSLIWMVGMGCSISLFVVAGRA
ncbi:MAG: MAPEG family protein, partial [Hyphomicrobium sp.]